MLTTTTQLHSLRQVTGWESLVVAGLHDTSPSSLFAPVRISTNYRLPVLEAFRKVSPDQVGIYDRMASMCLAMLDRWTTYSCLLL